MALPHGSKTMLPCPERPAPPLQASSGPAGDRLLWVNGPPGALIGNVVRAPVQDGEAHRRKLELRYEVLHRHGPKDWLGVKFLKAQWWAPEGEVVAYADVSLVFCTFDEARTIDILDAMRGVSQTLYDFGLLLSTTAKQSLGKLFLHGNHLALLERIEIRADLRGQGLGLELGQQLLAILHPRFQTNLIVLNPFPLQFSGKLQEASGPKLRALKQEFRLAQQRLSRLYEARLNAVPLARHDPHRAVVLEPGLQMRRDSRGWWLCRPSTSPSPI